MTPALSGTELLDPVVIAHPYRFYRRLVAEAPVWQVPGTDVFVVSSFAMVVEASARVDAFSSHMHSLLSRGDDGMPLRLPFGDFGVQTLATADPPMHAVHRGAVFPELVARRMGELEPEIGEVAARCVTRAIGVGSVDFMAAVGNVVPITMISRLIGFRDSDPELVLRAAFESTELLSATLSIDRLTGLVTGIGAIEGWIADQIAASGAHPGDDLLGTVARAVEADVFSVQEGTLILHTLLSAGGESTTSLVGSAVRVLAERPDLQARLRQEPALLPAFVEEVLRLESPFRYMMRSVPEDTRLGNVAIPAGATVLLFWGAANRDPAEYDHPGEVDLDRRLPRHHVAFGRGIHHCVGAPLARLEARIVVSALLEQTTSITLDPDRAPRWANSLLIRRYDGLPIRLTAS